MIIRDLYRCPPQDLHRAIAASDTPVLRRGVVEPPAAIEPADVDTLAAHADFDPSLSFVAYDGGEPAAVLVSRLEGDQAVWSLLGARPDAAHPLETLLDEALDHWRQEGAVCARKGLTGLLGTEPREGKDGELLALLEARDFELRTSRLGLRLDLRNLPASQFEDREAELRRRGYFVRAAKPDEVAVVARRFHPRHTAACTQEFWNCVARHLRPEGLAVADHRHQIVGFAATLGWTLDGDCPHLGPLFVEPVHRQARLEEPLLGRALLHARHAGKQGVRAVAAIEDAALYQGLGFQVTDRYCHEAEAELA
ncbi:MAG: GNAT family N-acetyltransferase [Candidatus Brocadiia bacterium]